MRQLATHLIASFFLFCVNAQAEQLSVAVAANFAAPMQKIAASFEHDTGHHADLVLGATGKFYAQIKNGAPYHLLLAADEATPARLEVEALTAPGTRFVYAVGQLALWSKQPNLVDAAGEVLRTGMFEHLAMADPKLAPYGAAALQTMENLGLTQHLKARWVQGESINQAYQFVATGNATLGFVALSQISVNGKITQGSAWLVPQTLYTPLRQVAVILAKGKNNAAAHALAAYLKSDKARTIIRAYGYGI